MEMDLAVTVTAHPGAPEVTYRLTVGPDGPSPASTVPDPAAAYRAVVRHRALLLPTLPPQGTTTAARPVFGGLHRAHVTGTLDGLPVDRDFSRTDSRETARWDALAPLLGEAAEA
ncbi:MULTISPECIES: serine protease inhibitor [Arthrobacter]|uniref:Serine protease inhibitor n=2 Tax=Arthrobacter TaxID=1663 RepID=A0ABU9KKP9_9MICC|nr:serine protease inhibitor [Arthrobacter sp. YJM1]MDP5226495.1 serine protease inhibitor [Arthrobacter sp. YJM1]